MSKNKSNKVNLNCWLLLASIAFLLSLSSLFLRFITLSNSNSSDNSLIIIDTIKQLQTETTYLFNEIISSNISIHSNNNHDLEQDKHRIYNDLLKFQSDIKLHTHDCAMIQRNLSTELQKCSHEIQMMKSHSESLISSPAAYERKSDHKDLWLVIGNPLILMMSITSSVLV
jgi:hypothetical protein